LCRSISFIYLFQCVCYVITVIHCLFSISGVDENVAGIVIYITFAYVLCMSSTVRALYLSSSFIPHARHIDMCWLSLWINVPWEVGLSSYAAASTSTHTLTYVSLFC